MAEFSGSMAIADDGVAKTLVHVTPLSPLAQTPSYRADQIWLEFAALIARSAGRLVSWLPLASGCQLSAPSWVANIPASVRDVLADAYKVFGSVGSIDSLNTSAPEYVLTAVPSCQVAARSPL